MNDLIVVGGGPAGLTATIYALHKRLDVRLVSKDLGGKTNFHLILPWIQEDEQTRMSAIRGLESVKLLRKELESFNCSPHVATVEKVRKDGAVFTLEIEDKGGKKEELAAKAIIIATGTRPMQLNIPGEWEYLGHGLAYSALSYAQLMAGHIAAVIGEGELAIRSAAELSTFASQVFLICSHGEMLDLPLGRKLTTAKNVKILEGYLIQEIKGDGEPGKGAARSLVVKSPQGKVEDIPVEGVFIEKGLIPNSQMVEGLVSTDSVGRILVDSNARTSADGIFAAGDVTNLFAEQVLVAVGEGAKAALSTFDYLLRTF